MQTEKKGSKDITPALSKHNAGPEDWLLLSNRNRKTHHEFECTGHVRTAKGCQIIRKHSSFVIQTNGCQKLDVWAGQRLGFFVKGMTATPPPPQGAIGYMQKTRKDQKTLHKNIMGKHYS
jgi:hypothetical protein